MSSVPIDCSLIFSEIQHGGPHQLLWERGSAFERATIEKLEIPFANLKNYSAAEREQLTSAATKKGDPLIYGGRIRIGNLLGEPDLLRREGTGYIARDIKSGAGFEGMDEESDGKPKKHYAVQLGLYQSSGITVELIRGMRPSGNVFWIIMRTIVLPCGCYWRPFRACNIEVGNFSKPESMNCIQYFQCIRINKAEDLSYSSPSKLQEQYF